MFNNREGDLWSQLWRFLNGEVDLELYERNPFIHDGVDLDAFFFLLRGSGLVMMGLESREHDMTQHTQQSYTMCVCVSPPKNVTLLPLPFINSLILLSIFHSKLQRQAKAPE